MKSKSSLEEFYKSLGDIEIINKNLDKKRDELNARVVKFNDNIQNLAIDKNIKKQNKEIAEVLENVIAVIKKASNTWMEYFEKMQDRERFRSELANYFIVIIFGKVKAGKSALGNFVASNRLSSQEVKFFKYDEAGKEQEIAKLEEINEDGFKTDNLECTSEIQGFKLGGMAWIDTPGLGSMTIENGELAKKYIGAADYIIYPTSSTSPLQKGEQEQIGELFSQNKKVTICITRSDTNIESECKCKNDENGCSECNKGIITIPINKLDKDRKEQEKHVNENIGDEKIENIYSISVKMAKYGMEKNNKEAFEDSNMPKFYNLITKVVKEKAVKFKEDRPEDTLRAFVSNIIEGKKSNSQNISIRYIKNEISRLSKMIQDKLNRFDTLKETASNDVSSVIEDVMIRYKSNINENNSQEMLEKINVEVNEKVSNIINKHISKLFEDLDKSLTSFATAFDVSDFEISAKTKTITYEYEVGSTAKGAVGGAAIGGALGFIFGPVGAAIGAAVGGAIGAAANKTTIKTESETINIGTDKEEVLIDFKKSKLEDAKVATDKVCEQLRNLFFMPLQKTIDEIGSKIDDFEKQVKTIF